MKERVRKNPVRKITWVIYRVQDQKKKKNQFRVEPSHSLGCSRDLRLLTGTRVKMDERLELLRTRARFVGEKESGDEIKIVF